MKKNRMSETQTQWQLDKMNRTPKGERALSYVDRTYDTDSLSVFEHLHLVEAFIAGFDFAFSKDGHIFKEKN
jgi:hypothetical protein